MFVSENVTALFKKGTLKLMEVEGGYRRVAEATCVIDPFPVELSRELGEEISGHLFNEDKSIREELEAIDLRVRAGFQHVTVRHHVDLEPIAMLSPVTIKDVAVQRVEDKKMGRYWLMCSFVLVFSLEDKRARNFVLDEFGKHLLLSFQPMQGELLRTADIHDSLAKLAEAGGEGGSVSFGVAGGKMHTIDPKKHRQAAKQLRADADTKH